MAGSPDFFTERKTPAAAIVAFAVLVLLAVPALLAGAEAVAERVRPGGGARLHDAARLVLLAVVALHLLNGLDLGAARLLSVDAPGWVLVGGAGLAGLALLSVVRRFGPVRTFVRLLAVTAPVALLTFLVSAPLGAAPDSSPARASRPVAIVMIVMDELPTTSLLKAPGRIDGERVPSFARLAREGTFYPNATTVADQTTAAMPSMLSGRHGPKSIAAPDGAGWPRNLFSLLQGQYSIDAIEPITQLCPSRACPAERPSTTSALGSLGSEAPELAMLSLAPGDLTRRSPLLGLGEEDDPGQELSAFIAGIADDERPTLDFLHVLAPHRPWGRLPSGKAYAPPGEADVPDSARESLDLTRDRAVALSLWRAHLLQVGYADRLLGRVIDHLERTGLYDRALLIVAADHGVSFRPGQPLRDVTRANIADVASVPLFVKRPGERGGGTDPFAAQTIDVLPTILDVIGAPTPAGLDGRSLLEAHGPPRPVRVLSTRSAYVTASVRELRAERSRRLEVQTREVLGSPLWRRSCAIERSGCR